MKRFFAALLAVMLVFSLCVTASAAPTNPADLTGHSYKAYQVFSGMQQDSANLYKVQWGNGIDSENFLAALQADATLGSIFASCTTAADVAQKMTTWSDNDANSNAFAKLAYQYKAGNGKDVTSSTTLDAGYYLIADVTTLSGTNTVRNLALLQLTQQGTLDIASKVDIPTVQKKVKDVNDSVANSLTGWKDSADYDIGDDVPFQLTATLGDISDYTTYKVVFHDTQANGFDAPDSESVSVQIDGNDVAEANYSFAPVSAGSKDFTVTIADVIAAGATSGSVITVEYTAKLNATANLGALGNENVVYLEYSNNPNYGGEGETGNTPEDKVVVYTYSVTINKKDEQGNALKGAGFSLYKYNPNSTAEDKYDLVKTLPAGEMETFVWEGIDDGNYKLVESTVPNGYSKMEDQYFVIEATHTDGDAPALTALTADGIFGDLESGAVDYSGQLTIEANVTNLKGSVLPETGGIGTTIFYAVGGVLVVAALVLLVTKKRMGENG